MSLVAAYSDSDSESASDADDAKDSSDILSPVVVTTNKESSKDLQIEDVDNDDSGKEESIDIATNLFSILPQPKSKEVGLVEENDDEFVKKKEFNEDVDIPRSTEFIETCDTLKGEKPQRRKFLNLPKPSKTAEKRKIVKISIPTMEEIGADSDSDNEECKTDNLKTESKKRSTLFSLLPKPKNSVNVGLNKNKVFSRETNRPLVPHTLTKKKELTKEPIKNDKNKKVKSLVNIDVSDSDDDDDDHGGISSDNFFSLGVDTCNQSTNVEIINKQTDTINSGNKNNIYKESNGLQVEDNSKCSPVNQKVSGIVLVEKKTQVVATNNNTKSNIFFSSLYKSTETDNDNRIKTELKKQVSTDLLKPESTNLMLNVIPESTLVKCNVMNIDPNKTGPSSKVTAAYMDSLNNVTVPYSDVMAHDDVTSPYNDAKSSYDNVTAPNNDVTAPNNDVTAPYNDVTAPYNEVTAPYNDVTAPYNEVTAPYNNVTAPYSNITEPYGNVREPYDNTNKKSYPSSQPFFSYAYLNYNNPEPAAEITEVAPEVDYYNKPNEDSPIDKDALKALQGSKRRKEDINLIDVRADDIQANSAYLKNLSTESVYQSKKSKKDQPTSGQKRKHQITYLAFQAKERELQLQQAWAENVATKRQTQGKYGF